MCPKHDTLCVLPEARGYTSWSASLTHWTADLRPLISPESHSDPSAHSAAHAGSPGSQLTQQYCVMLSYESLHTSTPLLHSGNQCQTKWMLQPFCVNMCVCIYYTLYEIWSWFITFHTFICRLLSSNATEIDNFTQRNDVVWFLMTPFVWSEIDQLNRVVRQRLQAHLTNGWTRPLELTYTLLWEEKTALEWAYKQTEEKNLCSWSETAFRLMSDVEQQLDQWAITVIGVPCLQRLSETEVQFVEAGCPPLPPPLAAEAQHSLVFMLLQARPNQSMHSTLFISK